MYYYFLSRFGQATVIKLVKRVIIPCLLYFTPNLEHNIEKYYISFSATLVSSSYRYPYYILSSHFLTQSEIGSNMADVPTQGVAGIGV